ncbi:MAG: glycosyltransferase [Gammaproteobacteria bacterium]|nr:glycosyltransferase [Gammaproteobacteria bacterium]
MNEMDRKRPKVIHAIETGEPGGAEAILVQLAESLRDKYEPIGLVMEEGWTSKELRDKGIFVECMPLVKSFDVSWVTNAARFIKENDVALIHSHEFSCNAYLTMAAKVAGVPIICTAHGKNYYPEKFYRRFAYRRVAATADSFIAVSSDLKDFIVDSIGIKPKQIEVILNGIEIQRFEQKQYDRNRIRAELSLSDDNFVIIVVAALFEMKGHKDLLQAIALLGDEANTIKLLFVGDGYYKPDLVKLTEQLTLEDKVRFLGFRSDVAQLLSASDLFILPSYSEGLPVSVLEAMAAKTLVLATHVGGLGELIHDGKNGYLVEPKAAEQLADKIRLCYLENEAAAETMREAAYTLVCERFSSATMLQQYVALYQKLIDV